MQGEGFWKAEKRNRKEEREWGRAREENDKTTETQRHGEFYFYPFGHASVSQCLRGSNFDFASPVSFTTKAFKPKAF